MSAHEEAGEESKAFCDRLYNCLSERIPNLNCLETPNWCGLYQEGKKKFAHVRHRKWMSRIQVYCLGDPTELQENTSLNIKPETGWFKASFFVDHFWEIDSACELLYQVSHRLT